MHVREICCCVVIALLALPAPADDAPGADEVPGTRDCVGIARIDHTEIIDDQTILFYMRGNEVYLNRLPRKCPGLRPNETLSYETSQAQLCNVDLITVLRRFGGSFSRGAACGLGRFEPIEPEAIAALKEKPVAEPDDEAVAPEIEDPDAD